MPAPLEGKVAVVTGSSRGIGKAIALQLAADGADIAVCARSDNASTNPLGTIERTAAEIAGKGRRALPLKLDVTSDADIHAMTDVVLREFGRVDILVNNAALMGSVAPDFWKGSPDALDAFYRTNLRAPYFISQQLAPHMVAVGGGVIINITSGGAGMPAPPTQGRDPGPGTVHIGYGITKAALNRWSAGMAAEMMSRNIAIVCVDPGLTVVERNLANPRPGVDYSNAERPETTARAVAFICAQPMAFTGRVIVARSLAEEHGFVFTGEG